MSLAGTPAQVECGGISLFTKEQAPIVAPSPIMILPTITQFAYIVTLSNLWYTS